MLILTVFIVCNNLNIDCIERTLNPYKCVGSGGFCMNILQNIYVSMTLSINPILLLIIRCTVLCLNVTCVRAKPYNRNVPCVREYLERMLCG